MLTIKNLVPGSGGVEVYGSPTEKYSSDGSRQTDSAGRVGWRVVVLLPSVDARVVQTQAVTVFAPSLPRDIRDGAFVVFEDLTVGCFASNGRGQLYFHSSGVSVVADSGDGFSLGGVAK